MSTKQNLQLNINNDIADNSSNSISAADVRNNLIDMTDSLVFTTGSSIVSGSISLSPSPMGSGNVGSLNIANGTGNNLVFIGDNDANILKTGTGNILIGTETTPELLKINDSGFELTDGIFIGDGSGLTNITHTLPNSLVDGDGITDFTFDGSSPASVSVEIDGSTLTAGPTGLKVSDSGITANELASDAVETVNILDANVTNAKLANSSVTIGTTQVDLGATSTTLAGVTLTGAEATGSFTGSFAGDGSQLTGITSTPFPYDGAAIITGSLFVTGSSPFINMDVISNTEGLNVYSTDSGTDFTSSVLFNGFRAQANANTYAKLNSQGIQYSESPTTSTKLNFQTGLSTQNIITVPKSVTGTMALTSNTVTIGTTAVNLITPSTTLAGLTDVKVTGSLLVTGSGVTVTGSINLDTNNTTTNYLNVGTSDNWVRTFYNGSGNLIQFVDFRSGYDQVNTISTTEIEILDNIPSNANANSLKVGSTLIAGSPAAIYFGMIQNQGLFSTRLVFDDASGVNTTSTLIIPTNTGDRTIALKDEGYLVADLPTGTLGDRAYVTDATSPTYLGTLTGGGAVKCPVFYNGSAWVSA